MTRRGTKEASEARPRIILLDLYHGGHHPHHLECLLRGWAKRNPRGALNLVVSEKHAKLHRQLPSLARETPGAKFYVTRTPIGFGDGPENVVRRERLHKRVATHYARVLRADHLVFMFFDHAQLALALDLRFAWPLAISGIYFRPSFHYEALGVPVGGLSERLVAAGKQTVLRAALRNPHLRTLFCLDPFAARYITRWTRHTQSVFLPEPFWIPDSGVATWALDGVVEPGRQRLTFFGSLDDRKGIRPVLDALSALPESNQRRLALIFAGRVGGVDRDGLLSRIAAFDETSAVQVVLDDRFLPEAEIQPLLASSNLVLLTYQREHVGSSGGLVRAAAAGVPVLSTDHGLVGMQVRRHRLGVTLDAASPEAIRAALLAWLERPDGIPFDPRSAETFAAINTEDAFADTIFSRLLSLPRGEAKRGFDD
jgi:glycosyltransferase involved in cell wall biosynthesis